MPNMGFRRAVPAFTAFTLAVLSLIGLPSKGNAQFVPPVKSHPSA